MSVTIWHNPRCSKSRSTMDLLLDKGITPKILLYLEMPPSADELDQVLTMLGKSPRDIMRTNEADFKDLGLENPKHTRDDLIEAMISHPILIERPIVISGDRAAIGRPPESVLDIL